MSVFVIISDANHSSGANRDFCVHRDGCRGITRHINQPKFSGSEPWRIKADTAEEAVSLQVADFEICEQGFTDKDFHICLCCQIPEKNRNRLDTLLDKRNA